MYETRDLKLMQDMLYQYEYLVQRPYLHELFCLPMCPPPSCYEPIHLLQLENIPETSSFSRFAYILNALAGLGKTIAFIISSNCGQQSFYIGIKGQCNFALSLFQNGILQTFTNSRFYCIENPSTFLDDLLNPNKYSNLASSLVTLNESYNSVFLSDFTQLVGTHSDYVAFFLAEPINRSDIYDTRKELCEIYDVLSYFSQSNYTYYKSESRTTAHANATSSTNTSGQSVTNTCAQNNTESHSGYVNISASTPLSLSHRSSHSSVSTTQHSNGVVTTSTTTTTPIPTPQNTSSSTPKNINATVVINKGTSSSCGTNHSEANAQNCSEAKGNTSTHTNTSNNTFYQSLNFSRPNKCLQEAVTFLNTASARYNTLSRNTTFHFSTYFFSPCDEVSLRAAYSYVGLAQSSYSLSPNVVNCMASNHPDYANLYKYLRSFTHPDFLLPHTNLPTHLATPLITNELINSFYLPIT